MQTVHLLTLASMRYPSSYSCCYGNKKKVELTGIRVALSRASSKIRDKGRLNAW